ncbi:vacuolar atpase assembly integral membrane protein vma21 [Anaeramoeba ignava]|uniref:Vacuolar atpase assembly integral membrane protein vma21 n=1 Tax=Anaeramoeba ignava TaxID=1746090 RepID=A0A9Q0L7U7_ANAIG|nr:vacuolar atpase assembly integral membrane protein vma21 [Anaeramoeba ignava]
MKNSKDKTTFFHELMKSKNNSVFRKLLFFMILLLIIPVLVYYSTNYFLERNPTIKIKHSLVSAITSFLSVILILGIYVIVAFSENIEEIEDEKIIRKKPKEKIK